MQIHKTAVNAVENFQARAARKLDYSQLSLEAIEEMSTQASEFVDKMDKDQIDDLVQMFGCYVFEVARQEFGGQFFWHAKYNQPGEHVKYVDTNELNYEEVLVTTDELSTQFKCSYKSDLLPRAIAINYLLPTNYYLKHN